MIFHSLIYTVLAMTGPDEPAARADGAAMVRGAGPSAERVRDLKNTLARRKKKRKRAWFDQARLGAAIDAMMAAAGPAGGSTGLSTDTVLSCPDCGSASSAPLSYRPQQSGTFINWGGRIINVQPQVC